MGFVDRLIDTFGYVKKQPYEIGGSYFYPLHSGTFDELDYICAFNEIPELNAVINLKARTFSNGRVKAVNEKNEEVPGFWAANLLNNPNYFQDGKEFMRQTKIFHEVFGNEYVYHLFPVGFGYERTKALFSIPPNLIDLEYREDLPFWMFLEMPLRSRYVLTDGTEVPKDQILHLNDNKITVRQKNDIHILEGESKLKALTAVINNLRMAYESRGIILKYRGADGIISPDGKDAAGATIFGKDDKKILQNAWKGYGTLGHQAQKVITSVSAKFTPLTVNEPNKLGLFEETKYGFFKIIDTFGAKRELFVMEEGSTYANQREAEKVFYQDTTIPEANEWISSFNNLWLPDSKIKLIVDYMHLPIFQEDIKHKVEVLEKLVNSLSKMLQDGAITIDEYKEELKKAGVGKS